MRSASPLVVSLTVALAGCHPPDQAIYDEARGCTGVFQVGLSVIPSYQLRRAGLTYIEVDEAGLGAYESALKFGANTGRTKKVIMQEVAAAREQAWQTYGRSAASTSDRPSPRLLAAITACMPKADPSNA